MVDTLQFGNLVYEIVQLYKDGSKEPLDRDEVERLSQILLSEINLIEGNITYKEYEEMLDARNLPSIPVVTIEDATRKWLNTFSRIPLGLINKAYRGNPLEVKELTVGRRPDKNDLFPSWLWMWQFGSMEDNEWAYDHIKEITDCGFRVFHTNELNLFIGITTSGFSHLYDHWVPLYNARGLKWHNTEK